MNALTTQQAGTAVALQGAENPFAQYEAENRRTSIVGDMLKFNKGDWLAGQDERDVPAGTRFVANMDQLFAGWIRWQDNKPTDQLMGLVAAGHKKQRRSELGDNDESLWETDDKGRPRDPWQESNYLLLRGIDDEQLYTFTGSSAGSRNAVAELCGVYGREMRQRPDSYPIIEIGGGKYKHSDPQYGWVKFPTLKVVGWSPKSDFEEALAEAQADAEADEETRSETEETIRRREAANAEATSRSRPAGSKSQQAAPAGEATRF